MIAETIHWLSSFTVDEWLLMLGGALFLDLPRYLFVSILFIFFDFFNESKKEKNSIYLPQVTLLIPGLNESKTIVQCLESLYGSYPFLQIIVIDDGSTDGMFELAEHFAQSHPGILVLKRARGGGKSTAINFAIPYITGEITLVVDSDSTFGDNAIYKLIQPFKDNRVGGSSGSVFVRNPYDSLCTLIQSYEYLVSILVGRILSSKTDTLAIISGAFGAFRTDLLKRGYGMDVGPSEDSDITIRIRKMGYKIIFVPEAECFTDAPIKWFHLWKQRMRWDMGLVRINLRKHLTYSIFCNNFQLSNFLYWWDTIFFSIFCSIFFWVMLAYLFYSQSLDVIQHLMISVFLFYLVFGFLQVLTILFYSNNPKRDIWSCAVFPVYSFYSGFFLRVVRTISIIDEFINRSSYRDSFVPSYCQKKAYLWRNKY